MSGIIEAMSAIMDEVGAVKKGDYNQGQKFNFRGIDAVVNAVSPALRRHNVVVTPEVSQFDYSTVEVGRNRTQMGHVKVIVKYTFTAEDGSTVAATVPGEAMDSGDKATAKAMSVAFRTALLQALCLPTDEPDPDSVSYERSKGGMSEEVLHRAVHSVDNADAMEALDAIWAHAQSLGMTEEQADTLDKAISARKAVLEGS
jgi:hypothetical protein